MMMTSKGTAERPRLVASSIEFADVGSIRIAKIGASQANVLLELKPSDPARQYVSIVLQFSGTTSYTQQRRSVELVAGRWAVFDVGMLQILSGSADAEQLVLLIPRDQLEKEIDVRRIAWRSFSGTEGTGRILCHTANCMVEELPRMHVRRANMLGQTLGGLVSVAIQERLGASAQTNLMRHGLRDRIQSYIDQHLRDPNLSLDLIAKQLNCTKRYLHKVFQGTGESLSEYILQQRLERCRADLSNPELSNVSITEIALSWGFNSVSHFSRAFHLRFGVPPRSTRAHTSPMSNYRSS
jgi:AraC-like DNA-binding protein